MITVMSEIKSVLFENCFIWKSDFQKSNRNLAFENVMVQIKHCSNKTDLISDITVLIVDIWVICLSWSWFWTSFKPSICWSDLEIFKPSAVGTVSGTVSGTISGTVSSFGWST